MDIDPEASSKIAEDRNLGSKSRRMRAHCDTTGRVGSACADTCLREGVGMNGLRCWRNALARAAQHLCPEGGSGWSKKRWPLSSGSGPILVIASSVLAMARSTDRFKLPTQIHQIRE